ncbi:MAG: Ref family recombination enhancement nuclease [Yersinia sp. (in: enterobacteria)]|jgi:hypothetical protein
MNGRTPTKAERLYIRACIQIVGCIACVLDGREIENPETWTEFHHDPDFGSTSPGCHFRGFGICTVHHRGAVPGGGKLPLNIAVRHPVGSSGPRFAAEYGDDAFLCALVWERIPQDIKDEIGFDISMGATPPEEVGK